ncbi:MAG TPA: hypothetical protein VGL99_15485 [Chloroflexota bacterium]
MPLRRIAIEWSGYGSTTQVEWRFTPQPGSTTFVSVTESGFSGDDHEVATKAIASTGGFSLVLAGLKAYLEHNIPLNLVADRHPAGKRPDRRKHDRRDAVLAWPADLNVCPSRSPMSICRRVRLGAGLRLDLPKLTR